LDRARVSTSSLSLKLSLKTSTSSEVDRNQFTEEQLIQISKGLDKIDRFTWHHNSQSSPKNMQLIPTPIHKAVQHIGEGALSEGK
ncbi:TPA: HNH endonuclease, partial [Pasteurella multocida]|nr:HNH endonuclease [Pasteurella multocida]